MRLPRRRQAVPDEIRAAIDLQPGERVLAAARSASDDEGRYYVASDRALHVVGPDGVRRIRWDLIDQAVWSPPELDLQLRADEHSRAAKELHLVDQSADLPAVVRDRVTNSIVVNSRIDVTGGHARVVARRNSDTGLLQWRVVLSDGVNPEDPTVREAAAAELADLRSRLGV